KPLAPLAKTAAKVAPIVFTAQDAIRTLTAKSGSERLQAGADTVADLAGFMGPVGAAGSFGYTLGQLGDQGIGWASQKALGVDLSPSRGIAMGLTGVDSALSDLVGRDPSDPQQRTIGMKIAVFLGL